MNVAVIVPYRSSPERDRIWAWLKARYRSEHPTWEIVEGSPPEGPWVKALAVADAISRTVADLFVIADADVWCDATVHAVTAVNTGECWAVPHMLVHRLDQPSTDAVLAGNPLGGTTEQAPYRGFLGGGIVVITRTAYQQTPLDPGFIGWGQEDEAWAFALRCIHGTPWRGAGPLWHLWHPPQPRETRAVGSYDGLRLLERYRQARNDPQAMRRLLEVTWAST